MRFEERNICDTISVEKAKQLFPRKLHLRWIEAGEQQKMISNIISVWLNSSQKRNEIYHIPIQTPIRRSPLVRWLAEHLNDPLALSPIRFGGLNSRKLIYESFLSCVNATSDWNSKSISQEFYKMLPLSKPMKNHRLRRRGVDVIFIPSKSYCEKLLQQWQSNDINLIF